jgi:hypothetical protein
MLYQNPDSTGELSGTVTIVAIIAAVVLGIPLLVATVFAIIRLSREEKRHANDMSEANRGLLRQSRLMYNEGKLMRGNVF